MTQHGRFRNGWEACQSKSHNVMSSNTGKSSDVSGRRSLTSLRSSDTDWYLKQRHPCSSKSSRACREEIHNGRRWGLAGLMNVVNVLSCRNFVVCLVGRVLDNHKWAVKGSGWKHFRVAVLMQTAKSSSSSPILLITNQASSSSCSWKSSRFRTGTRLFSHSLMTLVRFINFKPP